MVASLDVAVVGVVSADCLSTSLDQDNELERPFRINRFEIDVEEVLVGSLGKPSIVLRATEIFLSALHDTARAQPGERSVLFLENIGVEFLPLGYDSEDN